MDGFGENRYKFGKKIAVLFSITAVVVTVVTIIINSPLSLGGAYRVSGGGSYVEAAYSPKSSMIVIEQTTGNVLKQENIHTKLPMASTTKILTAITAIKNAKLDEIVTVHPKAAGVEGSSIYLRAGDKLYLKDLLYGLMLRSGNDAAMAIAYHVGQGNPAQFMHLMNETAKKAGALESNFINPHGLHDKNHYTTAYDLAMITRYAMKNADFAEISATKSIRITSPDGQLRVFANKNKMLSLIDGGNGGKTGYTKAAGRCLVSTARRKYIQLICVVLNVPDMWNVSKNALNSSFKLFNL